MIPAIQDDHAERSVLASVLLENHRLDEAAESIATPDDFFSDRHQRIWTAMVTLSSAGTAIDHVTLRDQLEKSADLKRVGGDEYLLGLTSTIPSAANIEAHAQIVSDKAAVRRVGLACQTTLSEFAGGIDSVDDFLDQAEARVFAAVNRRRRAGAQAASVGEVLPQVLEELGDAERHGSGISGQHSGLGRLDRMTAGMHDGDLIVVAGRPGMGKTSLAMGVATKVALAGRPVAVASLEMPKDRLVRRMLCSEARVDSQRARTGTLASGDWDKLAAAAGGLSQLPLTIDDTPAQTIMQVRSFARRVRAKAKDIGLVVVDYMQLMSCGSKKSNREQEISEISRSLKALAKELECPVMALSQLNRNIESRPKKDRRPRLSDLRESGAIEQDADVVLFVYRDEVYNPTTEERGVAEIIIGKQREGPTGTCRVRFLAEFTRFEDLADDWRGDLDDFSDEAEPKQDGMPWAAGGGT